MKSIRDLGWEKGCRLEITSSRDEKGCRRSHLWGDRRSLGIDRLDSHHLAILVALASKREARIRAQKEPGLSPAGHRQGEKYPLGSLMDLTKSPSGYPMGRKREGSHYQVTLGAK
jgi:hypothetical protein